MSEASHVDEGKPPSPQAQIIQFATGYWLTRLIYLAAELNLADHLASGSKTSAELATATSTHAPSLHRVMRALSSLGVFTEDADHRFALTPMGNVLRSNVEGSVRSSVLTLAGHLISGGVGNFLHSVKTGKTGLEKAFGMKLFDYLAAHPDEAAMFTETMVGLHGAEPAAVAAAYDFSKFERIVDVGGASGNMLAAIFNQHAGPKGVLFDLPHVTGHATALRALGDRISIESGSFFEGVPAGGDVYLLSHIIHDWSEEECVTILSNCRKAMKPGGRVLIIEMVLRSDTAPDPGKVLDMIMLTVVGGQERTTEEYKALLAKAGLRLERVIPTASEVSIVEAFAAS